MPKLDLVGLARDNKKNILTQYAEVLRVSKSPDVIVRFIDYLKSNLRVSVNSTHQNLVTIIKSKAYLSAFEFTRDYKKAIKHYGARKKYRILVDSYFRNGRLFKYFALNSGNMGTPVWGPYCIILALNYFDSKNTVILKSNSLDKTSKKDYYYFTKGRLNELLFGSDLATVSNSNELCVIKHSASIPITKENDWSELICKCQSIKNHNNTNYIEVISYQKCLLDNNFNIRMQRKSGTAIYKSFKDLAKTGKMSKGWNILKNELNDLIQLQKDFKFNIEFV